MLERAWRPESRAAVVPRDVVSEEGVAGFLVIFGRA